MVNTGKPSKGCDRCRARRIKCDEGKPECSRCVKYKKPCPGYRDNSEDKLRYKPRAPRIKPSADAVRVLLAPRIRSSTPNREKTAPSSGSLSPCESMAIQRLLSAPEQSIHKPLMDQMEVQAECYFITNFVKISEAGPNKGYLDFVIPLLNSSTVKRCLPLAFSAVTQAAFSTHQRSPMSLSKARAVYLRALSEINLALRDPMLALDDSVLASVLLLAKYEQISSSEMAIRGWRSHVDGALTLLKARSAEQRKSRYGPDLVVAVREQMIPLTIAAGMRLDPYFDWLEVKTDDLDTSFSRLNIKMSHLQADYRTTTTRAERSSETTEKVVDLLQRSKDLEHEYDEWLNELPSSWIVESADWSRFEPLNLATTLVYPGRVDVFGDLWMANKYSAARSCKVMIWSTILRCVAWLNGPDAYMHSAEYVEGSIKCRVIIEDIISSAPYYFGWTPETSPRVANTFEHDTEIRATMKGPVSVHLLWPLYVAATSDFSTPSERIYLRGKLQYIGDNLGVSQARIALKDGLMQPSWFITREGETFVHHQAPHTITEEDISYAKHIDDEWLGKCLKQIQPV
ncbi:hypothetical protein VTL71DRAFT_13470 [Oculimacula yallundae]|uniref:Zn(2)-C6 fungal-type domain-containing protein n=1 Tax=Oculimacula yallundae TaxID=86028 RepID=A0ABR4CMY9_9HELO